MSRGIGPVLLTHFTPDDDTDVISDDEPEAAKPAESAQAPAGVIVAPAPTGKVARHRAGRGRRAVVLTKSPSATSAARAASQAARAEAKSASTEAGLTGTSELPRAPREYWYRSPRLLRAVALAGGAVVLLGFALGLANTSRDLAGNPTAVAGSTSDGMQPGTLPSAALAGVPTTTSAAPPPPPPPVTTTHHASTPHTKAAAPPPANQSTAPNDPVAGLPVPGQSCGTPGQFSFDAQYQPVECMSNPATGAATWQQF
ncbi:MAG TPA: hypothetical protein VHX38_15125 [Pseudonocardiaceae bacterium]|nr:hypothetical protein [Pseudonocardiaceae bacterium]